MSKYILSTLFLFVCCAFQAQDTVVLTTGDTLACKILFLDDEKLIFLKSGGNHVMKPWEEIHAVNREEPNQAIAKPRVSLIKIYLKETEDKSTKGIFYAAGDSILHYIPKYLFETYKITRNPALIKPIQVSTIQMIKWRNKSAALYGAAIGIFAGIVGGIIVGLANKENQDKVINIGGVQINIIPKATAVAKGLRAGTLISFAGVTGGALIGGSSFRSIYINGNIEKWDELKDEIPPF